MISTILSSRSFIHSFAPVILLTERVHFHFSLSCIGEGNGNPLQCSCLENPRERGAWWAAVYGVTQSRTQLKWLSSSSSSSSVLFNSVCLFFSSSRSLVNIYCIFSIFASIVFLRSWIIFTIILNSISGRLPVSTSLSCYSEILSCPFIWNITFCYFVVINFL